MASISRNIYEKWISISDADLSIGHIEDLKQARDDLWVAAACVDRILDSVTLQRALLEAGLSRTAGAIERSKDAAAFAHRTSEEERNNALVGHFCATTADAQLCCLRSVLLQRLDRLNTFSEMQKEAPLVEEDIEDTGAGEENGVEVEIEDDWDDPWAEEPTIKPTSASVLRKPLQIPFSLGTFLVNDLLWSACQLASEEWFSSLQILLDKHGSYLWPFRLTILDSVPEYVHPSEYQQIALRFDFPSYKELEPSFNPWRTEVDLSESETFRRALRDSGAGFSFGSIDTLSPSVEPQQPLSADAFATWYKDRANKIIASTGMVDNALALIQYGASQGIPSLDELGEELSLLSRLVYDTPHPDDITEDWTLKRWQALDPPAVVRAYLSRSAPDSLANDISRLVLPYLYVLEARLERAGIPDPDLPNRLLYDFILSSRLELAASVFDASKPTLPVSQRIVKREEDLVCLALSCLYGSESLDEWATMSRIFECLPAWDHPRDEDNDEDVVDTTIASLGTFVTPSMSHPRVSPVELMCFFKPLHVASLSRALDILDVHLEAGEIFSRWSVPAPLRWFLQSNDDAEEQRVWANRMARRAGGTQDQLSTIEDWEWLLEDMLKLTGKSETGVKNAFGHLSEDEIFRIFLGGLLSAGKFDIARSILCSARSKLPLNSQVVEEIVIAASHEIYDNASSGNYKIGDMKLAYDCLDVPPTSDRLVREKEFIEATSRISSFNVCSRPGIPISPIEIRLTKDRLSLVSRVLSSNNDAYKHTQVVLDLCYKLGFRGDATAEVRTLAMLADTALQAEDFTRAYENAMRMVDIVMKLRGSNNSLHVDNDQVQEATEVCWVGCFQLGRQSEFHDLKKKIQLLGRTLELCPPEKLHDVLVAWRHLEKEDIVNREKDLIQKKQLHVGGKLLADSLRHRQRQDGHGRSHGQTWDHASMVPSATFNIAASSLRTKLQQFHMPSPPLLSTPDAAALASRTFRSVAANFSFSVGQRSTTPSQASHHGGYGDHQGHGVLTVGGSGSSHVSEAGHALDDVSSQASKVFSKSIGWLIGVDEE